MSQPRSILPYPGKFCRTHHRVLEPVRGIRRRAAGITFNAKTLAALYGYPTLGDTLPAVAIIELGGGYEESDLSKFGSKVGVPVPVVTNISIDGAGNVPDGDPNGADGEVALDMQNVMGATLGKAPLIMLWAPNTDTGMADALKWVAANAKAHNIGSVSISWGGPEDQWSASSRQATDAGLLACQTAGVPVFAASGDNGSSDGESGVHVDYPASSLYCFGCGGTTGQVRGGVLSETVWTDTGGGYSATYPKPSYQVGNTNLMRLVPDGAAVGDPNTGYDVFVDGVEQTIGGTSAVAPMLAALVACLKGALPAHDFGSFVAQWYVLGSSAVNDIVNGGNGAYKAGVGLDPCTGRGSPRGAQIVSALSGSTPPPPPPIVPPPGTTPPVTRTLAQVLVVVNAEFTALEKSNPRQASLIAQVNPYIDQAITKAFTG